MNPSLTVCAISSASYGLAELSSSRFLPRAGISPRDLVQGMSHVVAKTKEGTANYHQRLHALNLADGRFLQLLPSKRSYRPRPARAVVWESPAGQLEVHYRGEKVAWEEFPAASRHQKPESATGHVPCPRGITRPGLDHPYKRNADREIKERRRRLLVQAVAARANPYASQGEFRHRRGHFNRGKKGDILKEV
jgi:hypothetical protein